MTHSDNGKILIILTATAVFIVLLGALISPAIRMVDAATGSFSTSATVNNIAPRIDTDTGASVTLQAGTDKVLYVYFNATDSNGHPDLNDATAAVTLSKTGETDRTSSGCTVDSHPDATSTRYNCTVTLKYYDGAGAWTINASVQDDAAVVARNDTVTLSVNSLDAISIVSASISFTGNPGTNNVGASSQPQQVNNTGNTNYNTVQLTGYDFQNGADIIGVGNATVNVADTSGTGQILVDNSAVTVTDSTLAKGANSLEDLYLWLDIPASTPAGSYSATSSWTIQVS